MRSFNLYNCKQLNHSLIDMCYQLRRSLLPRQERIIIDFDSTSHEQHGKKMEGVAHNYKGIWGLDSINAFDEYGLQYWHDVRPGNTYTSNGVTEIIHEIFNRMPKTKAYKHVKRYARADSGFCNSDFFGACGIKEVNFVVAMKENIYGPLIKNVKNWYAQNPNKKTASDFVIVESVKLARPFISQEIVIESCEWL
ncbi:MAG: transposase [Oligoflexales bacterium]|nr:transposase [Oligoflexales bacterium]